MGRGNDETWTTGVKQKTTLCKKKIKNLQFSGKVRLHPPMKSHHLQVVVLCHAVYLHKAISNPQCI